MPAERIEVHMSMHQASPGGADSPESNDSQSTSPQEAGASATTETGSSGMRAEPAPAAGGAGLGTQFTNRVPNSYKAEDGSGFQILRFGIDTLELTYPGVLKSEADAKLRRLKELAQSPETSDTALAQIKFGDRIFEVRESGARRFAYTICDANFWIQLSRGKSKNFPVSRVRISSNALAAKPPKTLDAEVYAILAELADDLTMPGTSRIDLFVDFCAPGIDMEGWHRSAWVTRAKGTSQHAVGNRFSGWSIGLGGAVSCRLYDKILEIVTKSPDKAYLLALWKEQGWDGESPVWRLEFQFRREILSQFKIAEFYTVLNHLNGLWSYATTEWLQLKLPDAEDSNRARWAVHPLWMFLSSLDWEGEGSPLTRHYRSDRKPDIKRSIQLALASLASFMAVHGIHDVEAGFREFEHAMRRHLDELSHKTDIPPEEFVLEKVEGKRRQFNSEFNPDKVSRERRAKTDPDVPLDRHYEGDSAAYKRSSDGG